MAEFLRRSRCGGVRAYREQIRDKAEAQGFIGRWLALLDDAKVTENDVAVYGQETAFELAGIRSSFAHLGSFPFIREREERGVLALHGLHFDIGSGRLIGLDKETGHFIALAED